MSAVYFPPPAGGALKVRDEGVDVVAAASILDLVGAGVTAADGGGGKATVTVPGGGATPASSVDYIVLTADWNASPGNIQGGPPRVALYGDLVVLMGVLEPNAAGVTQITNVALPAKYRPNARRQFLVAHGGFAALNGVSRDVNHLNGLVVDLNGQMQLVYGVNADDDVILDGCCWRPGFAAGW